MAPIWTPNLSTTSAEKALLHLGEQFYVNLPFRESVRLVVHSTRQSSILRVSEWKFRPILKSLRLSVANGLA